VTRASRAPRGARGGVAFAHFTDEKAVGCRM
jgi:hypothetical protein